MMIEVVWGTRIHTSSSSQPIRSPTLSSSSTLLYWIAAGFGLLSAQQQQFFF
jgi:hypothetical protein